MRAADLTPAQRAALVEQGFRGIALHRFLGLEMAGIDPIVVELPLSENASVFGRGVHGGALATLIDVAANAAAAASEHFELGRTKLVTLELHVRYRGQPRSDRIRAEPVLVDDAGGVLHVRCRVVEGEGRVLAEADVRCRAVPAR